MSFLSMEVLLSGRSFKSGVSQLPGSELKVGRWQIDRFLTRHKQI